MLGRTLKVSIIRVLIFEQKTIILNRIGSNDANRRRDIIGLISFSGVALHCSEGQAACVARYRMISSLPHSIVRGRIDLLLANLSITERLILVRLLLRRHLRLLNHTSVRFRHAVDVLIVQEVIDDLMTVLITRSLAVVWTQDVHPLVWLAESPLRHHDRASLAERAVWHSRLHSSSMLTLYAKT